MLHSKEKQEALRRLNRIVGQVEGVKKMVNDSRYCVEILTQIAASRAALSSVGQYILEDHLKTCVTTAIKQGKGNREIKELMNVFKKL